MLMIESVCPAADEESRFSGLHLSDMDRLQHRLCGLRFGKIGKGLELDELDEPSGRV